MCRNQLCGGLIAVSVLATACTRDVIVPTLGVRGGPPAHADRSADPGFICEGDSFGTSCGGITFTASFPPNWDPYYWRLPTTKDTVSIIFSAPVTFADIDATAPDSIPCTDDRGLPTVCILTKPGQGTVVGFDPNGVEGSRAPLVPVASDLSMATATGPAGIVRVLVLPTSYLQYAVAWDLFENTVTPPATVSIDYVRGSNPGGSFTTQVSENTIQLSARADPDSFAPRVRWVAVDAPDDAVATAPPWANHQRRHLVIPNACRAGSGTAAYAAPRSTRSPLSLTSGNCAVHQ